MLKRKNAPARTRTWAPGLGIPCSLHLSYRGKAISVAGTRKKITQILPRHARDRRGDTLIAPTQDEAGTIMVKCYCLVPPGENLP